VICNIDNCHQKANGSWLSNEMFMIYACTKHFKKYHLTFDEKIPLKPKVRFFHVRRPQ